MQNDLPRPIFLLGIRESGGHLLQYILSKHPDLATCHPASPAVSVDRLARPRAPRYLARVVADQQVPTKMRSDAHLACFAHPAYQVNYRLTEDQVEPGDREAVVAMYRAAMADATRRLISHDPPNLLRGRFLQALFPDAYFVLVVRDPYANVAAASRGRSRWGTLEEQALHWWAAYEALLADRRFLKRRMLVRYEQLVADPIATLEEICTHCRLDFMPELLAGVELRADANERLIAALHPRELRIVTRACRRTMVRMGYLPRDKSGAVRQSTILRPRPAAPQPAVEEPRQAA